MIKKNNLFEKTGNIFQASKEVQSSQNSVGKIKLSSYLSKPTIIRTENKITYQQMYSPSGLRSWKRRKNYRICLSY